MSLSSLLAIPELEARYKKVKKFFYLREAAYDVTSVCQLRCDGCYYFEGEKYKVIDNRDPLAWRQLLQSERERGITYVNLAGAEPSMVPEILRACYQTIPLGTVFTNGLERIATGNPISPSFIGVGRRQRRSESPQAGRRQSRALLPSDPIRKLH